MKVERRVKKLNLSPKVWIFYIGVLIILVWVASKIFISPEEIRLLNSISKDPTNVEKIVKLADYYYEKKVFTKSVDYYKRAIALYEERNVPCNLYKKVIKALMQLKMTESIDYIQKAMKKCDDPDLLYDFVKSLDYTIKKIDTKIVFFRDKKPGLAKKLKEVGKIYLKKALVLTIYYKLDERSYYLNRLKEKDEEDYQILKNYPRSIKANFLLGKYAKDCGLYDISRKLLYKSLNELKGADKGKCFYNLAYLYYHDKQYSKALEYYKEAKKYWNSTKVNYWLSKTYLQLGNNKMALKAINYTLKLDPKYVDAMELKQKILGE